MTMRPESLRLKAAHTNRLAAAVTLTLSLLASMLPLPAPAAAPADFSIAVLPDTQFYSKDHPDIFDAQINWIISNRVSLNIVYVAGLGDIVDGAADETQWHNATNALYRLEDPLRTGLPEGIPYGVVPGNHDHALDGSSLFYDHYFGLSHFQKKPWYGGNFQGNNNHFDRFSAGGMDFVVVYVDFWAKKNQKVDFSAEDAWADGVLKANTNRRAIVVSHTAATPKNVLNPRGQELYDRLKRNPNLFLLLCGHIGGEGHCQNTFEGHTVYSCLSDYQNEPNGGDGWLRLYQFSPANNRITVKTYSPTLNQWRTAPASQFTLNYPMSVAAH